MYPFRVLAGLILFSSWWQASKKNDRKDILQKFVNEYYDYFKIKLN